MQHTCAPLAGLAAVGGGTGCLGGPYYPGYVCSPAEQSGLQLAGGYGLGLPHTDVAYDKTIHELREYGGLSNIRDVDDVTAAGIERAGGQPPTRHCVLQCYGRRQ